MNTLQKRKFNELEDILIKHNYFCYKSEDRKRLLIMLYQNVGQYTMHFVKDFIIDYTAKNYNFNKEVDNIIKFVKENERE